MASEDTTPHRPWEEIAAELAQEYDAAQITMLATELAAAMDAQTGRANVSEPPPESARAKKAS